METKHPVICISISQCIGVYQHWCFIIVSVSVCSNPGCLYGRRGHGQQSPVAVYAHAIVCSQLHCVCASMFVVQVFPLSPGLQCDGCLQPGMGRWGLWLDAGRGGYWVFYHLGLGLWFQPPGSCAPNLHLRLSVKHLCK